MEMKHEYMGYSAGSLDSTCIRSPKQPKTTQYEVISSSHNNQLAPRSEMLLIKDLPCWIGDQQKSEGASFSVELRTPRTARRHVLRKCHESAVRGGYKNYRVEPSFETSSVSGNAQQRICSLPGPCILSM